MLMIRKMAVTTQVALKPGNPNRMKHLTNGNLIRMRNPMSATLVMHSLARTHPAASPQMARRDQ